MILILFNITALGNSYKYEIEEDMTVTANKERRSVNDQISFLE
jgi:hypothetical protein